MLKKIIIALLMISYLGLSQFVIKAYITTEQPSNQDFCIVKSLEKHENTYQCWKDKNNMLSVVQLDLVSTNITLPSFFAIVRSIQDTYLTNQQTIHKPHAPPDIIAQTNYSKNFLI
jgi:hypothetical protein